jgi:hypothetical protein
MPQKLFGGGGVQDVQLDGPVAVGDPVSQPHRLNGRCYSGQRHQADLVAEQFGEFAGELLGFQPSRPGCSVERMSLSLSGAASPRAREPNTFSSAIPQMAPGRASLTSTPGMITMI